MNRMIDSMIISHLQFLLNGIHMEHKIQIHDIGSPQPHELLFCRNVFMNNLFNF